MCLPQRGHGSDSPETEPLSDTLLADGGHYIMLPFNQSPGTSIHSFHSISQITATRSFNRVITPTTPPKKKKAADWHLIGCHLGNLRKHKIWTLRSALGRSCQLPTTHFREMTRGRGDAGQKSLNICSRRLQRTGHLSGPRFSQQPLWVSCLPGPPRLGKESQLHRPLSSLMLNPRSQHSLMHSFHKRPPGIAQDQVQC